MNVRLYIELAAGAILILAFGLFVHHERQVGAQAVQAADAKATAAARALADTQTKHAQEIATQAELDASHEQKSLDNYALAHPLPIVRVCRSNTGGPSLPQTSTTVGGTPSAGPGPAAVSDLPDGAADISPGLAIIVLAAGRLAVIDAERQMREKP